MQTNIHPNLKSLPGVAEAEDILRSCVHCGFCTAVCPTYQELGDDLDSPRGRIYLIKDLLEEDSVGQDTHQHLDRCLSCRSCETTCPSGVEYTKLLDVGRGLIQTRYQPSRPLLWRAKSWALRFLLPKPQLFSWLYSVGKVFRPILPRALKAKMPLATVPVLPSINIDAALSLATDSKQVLVLEGCVQRSLTPGVNRALEHLLAQKNIGVTYLAEEGCCGAVDYHLGHHEDGLSRMRVMVDRLFSQLDDVESIISSASGCGVTLKDYPDLLRDDHEYATKARAVVAKIRDVSEVISGVDFQCRPLNVAVHTPCTLGHGQKSPDAIAGIITAAGGRVVPVAESHLCCGSAGTYSVLEPELSSKLAQRKMRALMAEAPDVVVTANVGCQTQLSAYGDVPVMHWVEFLAHYQTR